MSSTYYTNNENSGKKVSYLIEGIKKHQIFNSDIKFWEACILYKNFNMKATKENESKQINTLQGKIVNNILAVVFHMNDIMGYKPVLKELANKYVQAYKIPEGLITSLVSFLSSLQKAPTK